MSVQGPGINYGSLNEDTGRAEGDASGTRWAGIEGASVAP